MDTGVPASEASADSVCRALAAQRPRIVVLDFDNTLLLDNSSERFLDNIRPKVPAFLVAALADLLLQALALLRRRDYNVWRDWHRVWVCVHLIPWSMSQWRRA